MKILTDDIIYNLQIAGGISVYWYELSKRLNTKFKGDILTLSSENSKNIFLQKIDFNVEKNTSKYYKGIFSRYININARVGWNIPFIFHSSYYRISKKKTAVNVVTVHDFTYELKLRGMKRYAHIIQKKYALRKADGIICISNNTKTDMYKIYPNLKTKPCKVIYNGYNSESYFKLSGIKTKNNVIFVGGRNSYKNFKKAVEIVSLIKGLNLVIVGGELTDGERKLVNSLIPNRYTVKTHISNDILNILYNEAVCLLYLSEYEGFGIPPLEAMSSGCPVIALNKSSISEVVGSAGVLFDEIDIDQIVYTIQLLQSDKDYRNKIVDEGLRNVKRFSWDKCANEVIEFYSKLIESRIQ